MKKRLAAYLSLTKPRIGLLVLVVTAFGFFLGAQGAVSYLLLFYTLLGTILCCAGSATLNAYLERDLDALMMRTCKRALPQKEVAPADALGIGLLLVIMGISILAVKVNLLTSFLALLTGFLYVLIYTPLKRVTWLNTIVGAIPGALPPLGGWAAATGGLSIEAWVLFFILFLWQHPHFYAIAWMYREDYARAGFKMLSVVDPNGQRTFRQINIFSVLLLAASVLPTIIGLAGYVYLAGALVLGFAMLCVGYQVAVTQSVEAARRLVRASVLYLPLLFALIVTDARF